MNYCGKCKQETGRVDINFVNTYNAKDVFNVIFFPGKVAVFNWPIFNTQMETILNKGDASISVKLAETSLRRSETSVFSLFSFKGKLYIRVRQQITNGKINSFQASSEWSCYQQEKTSVPERHVMRLVLIHISY